MLILTLRYKSPGNLLKLRVHPYMYGWSSSRQKGTALDWSIAIRLELSQTGFLEDSVPYCRVGGHTAAAPGHVSSEIGCVDACTFKTSQTKPCPMRFHHRPLLVADHPHKLSDT